MAQPIIPGERERGRDVYMYMKPYQCNNLRFLSKNLTCPTLSPVTIHLQGSLKYNYVGVVRGRVLTG